MKAKHLDIHSSFTYEKYFADGLVSHFNCRRNHITAAGRTEVIIKDPGIFWNNEDGFFHTIAQGSEDTHIIAIYSVNSFEYPVLAFDAILPDIPELGINSFWIGLENGSSYGNAYVSFAMDDLLGPNTLWAHIGHAAVRKQMNLTKYLPADYLTKSYWYGIQVLKNLILFEINGRIRGIAIRNPPYHYQDYALDGPPYDLCLGFRGVMSNTITTLLEVSTARQPFSLPGIDPSHFRVSNGIDKLPFAFKLYTAGTDDVWASSTVAGGTVTSQAIPFHGFDRKTVMLYTDQAGTLTLQTYTEGDDTQYGNWRNAAAYATVANTLLVQTITDQFVVCRFIFTPDAYPCIIGDAQVVLN